MNREFKILSLLILFAGTVSAQDLSIEGSLPQNTGIFTDGNVETNIPIATKDPKETTLDSSQYEDEVGRKRYADEADAQALKAAEDSTVYGVKLTDEQQQDLENSAKAAAKVQEKAPESIGALFSSSGSGECKTPNVTSTQSKEVFCDDVSDVDNKQCEQTRQLTFKKEEKWQCTQTPSSYTENCVVKPKYSARYYWPPHNTQNPPPDANNNVGGFHHSPVQCAPVIRNVSPSGFRLFRGRHSFFKSVCHQYGGWCELDYDRFYYAFNKDDIVSWLAGYTFVNGTISFEVSSQTPMVELTCDFADRSTYRNIVGAKLAVVRNYAGSNQYKIVSTHPFDPINVKWRKISVDVRWCLAPVITARGCAIVSKIGEEVQCRPQ